MLTADTLRSLLSYCPDTGEFTWVRTTAPTRIKPGQRAGCVAPDGYRVITIMQKVYKEHRLAWLYMTGEWPTHIDHINRDRADNRFSNLRLATQSQNVANRTSWNRYGFKGISPNPRCKTNPWRATIEFQRNGKRVFKSLGVYKTKEEAHEAYLSALREVHNEFAAP